MIDDRYFSGQYPAVNDEVVLENGVGSYLLNRRVGKTFVVTGVFKGPSSTLVSVSLDGRELGIRTRADRFSLLNSINDESDETKEAYILTDQNFRNIIGIFKNVSEMDDEISKLLKKDSSKVFNMFEYKGKYQARKIEIEFLDA